MNSRLRNATIIVLTQAWLPSPEMVKHISGEEVGESSVLRKSSIKYRISLESHKRIINDVLVRPK